MWLVLESRSPLRSAVHYIAAEYRLAQQLFHNRNLDKCGQQCIALIELYQESYTHDEDSRVINPSVEAKNKKEADV